MTDTERHVNMTCEWLVATGDILLYRDLYKDLRETLPCGEACRLIAEGFRLTRHTGALAHAPRWYQTGSRRARAIAALTRLERWARRQEIVAIAEAYNGR